jgi:hypothetical protein
VASLHVGVHFAVALNSINTFPGFTGHLNPEDAQVISSQHSSSVHVKPEQNLFSAPCLNCFPLFSGQTSGVHFGRQHSSGLQGVDTHTCNEGCLTNGGVHT